jgi:hypothetical protein
MTELYHMRSSKQVTGPILVNPNSAITISFTDSLVPGFSSLPQYSVITKPMVISSATGGLWLT